jgi:hypothetical protein
MKSSQTTLFLLTAIILAALWRSGRLERVMIVVFGGIGANRK